MNLLIFIAGSLGHFYIKLLDARSTERFAADKLALGITEDNGWFSDRGRPVFWKFWIAVAAWQAFAIVLFAVGEKYGHGTFHPLYSLGVFALSTGASGIAFLNNKKLIRNARARIIRNGLLQ